MDLKSILEKLNFKKKSGPAKRVPLSPSLVFTILSLAVIFADVWMIQSAFRTIYQYSYADVGARMVQSTRVNFDGYTKAVERIENAGNYSPQRGGEKNPFAVQPRSQ
jgi:hypothetical protein